MQNPPLLPPRFFSHLKLLFLLLTGPMLAGHAAEPPALIVVISLDQFRQDYLEKFRPYFSAGGFNLFLNRGTAFTNCHYRHSLTKTGPGHAVLLSGVHANIHGIIANDWIDRNTFVRVNCVDDPSVEVLGLAESTGGVRMPGSKAMIGRSPKNYLVTTVGDELKAERGGQPRIIGISNKDRAAVLMGGQLASAAYYTEGAHFVSSTYYMKELPQWVRDFNAAGKQDAYFGRVWDRVLPVEAYAIQGPDDSPGEFTGLGLGRTFPKTVTGGDAKPGANFYETLIHTPFASEILADFARAAIENENLGRRGVTDMLCLSFSSTDYIGHDTGPESHEVMDMAVRIDRILEGLFKFLDARIGLDRCLIVLSADHGAAPLAERLKAIDPRFPAGRIDNALVLRTTEAALDRAFGSLAGAGRWIVPDGYSLLLAPEALAEKKIARPAAESVVRDALMTLDFVEAAYTRTQLEAGNVNTEYGRRALLSFNRERSGDVFYQSKPFWFDRDGFGTNHGSPYNYDTHVPLLWFGAGIPAGVRSEPVGVDDLAPTLARLLGLTAPPRSEGRALF